MLPNNDKINPRCQNMCFMKFENYGSMALYNIELQTMIAPNHCHMTNETQGNFNSYLTRATNKQTMQ